MVVAFTQAESPDQNDKTNVKCVRSVPAQPCTTTAFLNTRNKVHTVQSLCKKGSPCSITERSSGADPGSCSQPAGDVSHKPGGRLPLLSARPTVTLATLKRAATNFAVWLTEAR